jgi:hypothetical protein
MHRSKICGQYLTTYIAQCRFLTSQLTRKKDDLWALLLCDYYTSLVKESAQMPDL